MEFDALAAGVGGEWAIASLLRGEFSRRQLLFRLLLETARERAIKPGDLPSLDAAWELLVRAQQQAPDAVRELLMHPHVGMWAAHTVRVLRGSASDDPAEPPAWVHLGHLHALAVAAAARAKLDFELLVPVRHGAAFLPMLGAAALPGARRWDVAEVVGRDGALRVGAGPEAVAVPADPATDGAGWAGYRRVSATAGGQTLTLDLDDLDPYRGLFGNAPPARLPDSAVAEWTALLGEAWALLVRDHLPQAAELRAGLRALVPAQRAGRFRPHSASAGDSFGSAVASVPDDYAQLAVTLVHEFQHTKLNGLLHLVALHDDDGTPRLYAPWRDDPRPLGGLLQGAYAFLGVTRFYQIRRGLDTGAARDLADYEFALWRLQTSVAVRQLEAQPGLTELGRRFVDRLAAALQPWLAEDVPAEIATLTTDAAADHEATWRAYHRQPDDGRVAAAAVAWLAGQPAPAGAGSAVRTDPAARWLDTRAVLARVRLTDPVAFDALCRSPADVDRHVSGATPADVAYVAADLPTAQRLYLSELAATPDRAAAWSGLGLTLRAEAPEAAGTLLDRPEFARAIHRAVTARAPDHPAAPADLAAWLAPAP